MEDIITNVPETITFAKKITVEEYNKQKDEFTQKALKELNEQMKQSSSSSSSSSSIIKKNNNKLSISLPNSDNEQETAFEKSRAKNQEEDNYGNTARKTAFENIDSESDYNDNDENTNQNPSLNFIIKHYVSENSQNSQQVLKKRKNTSQNNTQTNQTTMSDAIYAQHELDMNTITKLKLQNNSLKVENEDLDKKKHYLTLELSNAQCDIGDLKKQVSYLKDENIKLKQFINIMKITDEKFELYIKGFCYVLIPLIILLCYMYL
jgi:hypothetical protein